MKTKNCFCKWQQGFNCNWFRRKIKIAFSGENNAVSTQTIHLLQASSHRFSRNGNRSWSRLYPVSLLHNVPLIVQYWAFFFLKHDRTVLISTLSRERWRGILLPYKDHNTQRRRGRGGGDRDIEKTERLVTFLQQKGTSTSPHRRLLIHPTKYKPRETRTNREKP